MTPQSSGQTPQSSGRTPQSSGRAPFHLPVLFLALGSLLLTGTALFAHGTEYSLLKQGVIGVRAGFDSGTAMAAARVLIFAPGQTETYLETVTDRNGVVCFAPDRAGTWILQVREQGGHGLRINLEVDAAMVVQPEAGLNSGRLNSGQKIVAALCVVWALAATALLFKKRRRKTG